MAIMTGPGFDPPQLHLRPPTSSDEVGSPDLSGRRRAFSFPGNFPALNLLRAYSFVPVPGTPEHADGGDCPGYYCIFRTRSRASNKLWYLPFISFDKKLMSISSFHPGTDKAIVSSVLSILLEVSSQLSFPK